jgi:hypothetical protein
MSNYSERVQARRSWELREIARAIYSSALMLTIVNVALVILLVYTIRGEK